MIVLISLLTTEQKFLVKIWITEVRSERNVNGINWVPWGLIHFFIWYFDTTVFFLLCLFLLLRPCIQCFLGFTCMWLNHPQNKWLWNYVCALSLLLLSKTLIWNLNDFSCEISLYLRMHFLLDYQASLPWLHPFKRI